MLLYLHFPCSNNIYSKNYEYRTTPFKVDGPGNAVSTVTGYRLDGPGIEPGGGEIFRTCPDRPWGPPSLLYNGYWVFPGGKERPGRDADPSPPSSFVGPMGHTASAEPQCLYKDALYHLRLQTEPSPIFFLITGANLNTQVHKTFQKSRTHLKIPDVRRVMRRKLHTGDHKMYKI
jgi:hypothetical protein